MNPRLLPAAAALLALAACGTTDTSGAATSTTGTAGASAAAGTGQCGKLTTSDAWVKAADTGMTGGEPAAAGIDLARQDAGEHPACARAQGRGIRRDAPPAVRLRAIPLRSHSLRNRST